MSREAAKQEQARLGRCWKDASIKKPEVGKEIVLFRRYDRPTFKHVTGFLSYGFWDGVGWHDNVLCCYANDVKYYHELPPLPEGEIAG